ncbi:MAG: DUF459 domain-containing protein [Treponema sp.]
MKIPDTTQEELYRTVPGNCTPNRVLLFVLFVIIGLIPFLGNRIVHPAHSIQNHSLRNIYTALAEPLAAAGMQFPTSVIIPALRTAFLQHSGLVHEAAWDSFFYTAAGDPSAEIDTTALQAEQSYRNEGAFGEIGITAPVYAGGVAEHRSVGTISVSEKQQKLPYYVEQKIIPFSAEHPLRLLFFGDSQMHFIASGMKRALGADPRIVIEEISIHSSGFLRSDYYNWPKKLEAVLAGTEQQKPFHAAVMILGMNDYQDTITEKGVVLYAGSPEWENFYRTKMHRHIAAVLHSVPRLYWLGLPAVRSAEYDEKIQYLDSLQSKTAEEYSSNSVIRVSLQDFVRKYGSGYVNTIHLDDKTVLPLMQSDGIHYSIPGSEYLMQQFLTMLFDNYLLEDIVSNTTDNRE